MIFVKLHIFFGFLMFIAARKTDTWPPQAIYKYMDVNSTVKICYEKSGADKKELMEFELTEDLEHLPDSRALKVYLRCFAEEIEGVERKSNKLLLSKLADFFSELTHEEQAIFVGMNRGCMKRIKDIKDPLEFIYSLTVCLKKNDNEHFHFFY